MRPIFIGASPNTQLDDVLVAAKQIFLPWSWQKGSQVTAFENEMVKYHGGDLYAKSFDSGRTSLFLLLRAMGVGEGDEVILPSFTCLAVANPVVWNKAKIVYVDSGSDYNMDLDDLKTKLTDKTKVVIAQHTFGKPINVNKIREIVGPDVKIVEDVAHGLGGELGGKKLGTLGDAAIFSFGVDKVISTTRGGMVLSKDKDLMEKISGYDTKDLPKIRILRYLINPVLWWLMTPFYYWGIGKFTLGRLFIIVGQALGIIGSAIQKEEYECQMPYWLPAKLPNSLAVLGINQIKKLDHYNEHRKKISNIYIDSLRENAVRDIPYLRFPILVQDRNRIIQQAKKENIILGEWYRTVLFIPEKYLSGFGYKSGMTPNTERITDHVINLPTGINVNESIAKEISNMVSPHVLQQE